MCYIITLRKTKEIFMKLYLDNCCFNRPFDDQSRIKIKLETDAKLFIHSKILIKKYELVMN